MRFNHELTEIAVKYNSRTGSRTRVRVPVAGVKHIGIKPGEKVFVSGRKKVTIAPLHKNSIGVNVYTVEKDGAIRIPANKFGLPAQGLTVTCDQLENCVTVM